MTTLFLRGQQLGREDLNIYLTNTAGNPSNAAEISYALYDFTTGREVLVGRPVMVPENPSVGEYYASVVIPLDANIGDYRIRWTFKELVGGPTQEVLQEFTINDRDAKVPTLYTGQTQALITSLRTNLRDWNPDKHYKFRPPTHEGTVEQYSRVFGFIWEDLELAEYLERATDMVIAAPPRTPFMGLEGLMRDRPEWKTLIIQGAMYWALQALQINWISEEFSLKGDTIVRVQLPDGTDVDLTIAELFEACYGEPMDKLQAVRAAFRAGALKVQAVDPASGAVSYRIVSDVLKHNTESKSSVLTTLVDGRSVVTTVDHSIFRWVASGSPIVPVQAGELLPGDFIAVVEGSELVGVAVASVLLLPPEAVTYDLSVPGPENFVLANGILAHNSYSIGGVSLDLERSSKYSDAKQSAKDTFNEMLEKAKATVKVIRGLQQPKWNAGLRSSFGPATRDSVLTPAKFSGY